MHGLLLPLPTAILLDAEQLWDQLISTYSSAPGCTPAVDTAGVDADAYTAPNRGIYIFPVAEV